MNRSSLLLIAVLSVLVVSNFLFAQKTDIEKAKIEIQNMYDEWNQFLLKGNVDDLKKFYPDDYKGYYIYNGNITETSFEESSKDFTRQFKDGIYTRMEFTEAPKIFVSSCGTMAWTLSEGIFEYKSNKSNKTSITTFAGIEVLEKINGQWVTIGSSASYIPLRDSIIVDEITLVDYEGKYKSGKSGNIYEVTVKEGNLVFTRDGQVTVYTPQSDCSFFTKGQAHNIIFGRDKNGKVTHYTWTKDNYSSTVNKIE